MARKINPNPLMKLYQANITDRDGKTQPVRITLTNFAGTEEEAKAKWEEVHVGKKIQSIKEIRALTNNEVKQINKSIATGQKPAMPA